MKAFTIRYDNTFTIHSLFLISMQWPFRNNRTDCSFIHYIIYYCILYTHRCLYVHGFSLSLSLCIRLNWTIELLTSVLRYISKWSTRIWRQDYTHTTYYAVMSSRLNNTSGSTYQGILNNKKCIIIKRSVPIYLACSRVK